MSEPNGPVYRPSGPTPPGNCADCGFEKRTHENLARVGVEQHDFVEPNDALIMARMQAQRGDRINRENDKWWRDVVYSVPRDAWGTDS